MDPRKELLLRRHKEVIRTEIKKEYSARGESIALNSVKIDAETERRSREMRRLVEGD